MVFDIVLGTVDEFIDFTLIIILILMIYYLIKSLFCMFGGGSDKWGMGDFEWPDWNKPKPEPPEKGHSTVHGSITADGSAITSKISLMRGGRTILEGDFFGTYKFENIAPANYSITSTPALTRYKSITHNAVLEADKIHKVDFFHLDDGVSPPPEKSGVKGNIINGATGKPMKSKISLEFGGVIIKSFVFTGSYEFLSLDPGDYKVISEPGGRCNKIEHDVTLSAGKIEDVDFLHTCGGSPPSRKSIKNFLLVIADQVDNDVIVHVKSGEVNTAKNNWSRGSKIRMNNAIALAEKYLDQKISEKTATPAVMARIVTRKKQLINQLKFYRVWMDKEPDFKFVLGNPKLLKQLSNFSKGLGRLMQKTGKLLFDIHLLADK
jgi:hypothetical protein